MDNWYSKHLIILKYFIDVLLWTLNRQKGYGLMLFTRVIFSTCEFSQESLAIEKSALSAFMSEKWSKIRNSFNCFCINSSDYFDSYNIKRTFFTSPQLKITLFEPVFLQFALLPFTKIIIDDLKSQLIKRETNVSTYK